MKPHRILLAAAASLSLLCMPVTIFSSDESPMRDGVRAVTDFSAQARRERPRPRIRIERDRPAAYDYPRPGDYSWPGPRAVWQCVDWYATEYRPSGTVVTPQMRCRWVRG